MNSHSSIILRGCRQNNLKNISLTLPKFSVIAITGVSGSGKSSLAFDTLFAEGQRRYLEYLSSQASSKVKQSIRPDVDFIEGLSPTLAISQKQKNLYSRGTIATYTEIYDFLALLFSSIGQQYSPITGKKLIRYTRQEIIHALLTEYPHLTKIQLIAPISLCNEAINEAILRLQKMGFIRFRIDGQEWTDELPIPKSTPKTLEVVVDRLQLKEGIRERLGASVETALDLSLGILKVIENEAPEARYFTEIFVCPETLFSFAPLKPCDFNFNSPHGACKECQGRGKLFLQSQDDSEEVFLLCQSCHGKRLKKESLSCLITDKNISDLCALSVHDLTQEIEQWSFSGKEAVIAAEILPNIVSRLSFLDQVGLSYLELNREGNTLSDGEAHRIQLASHIGAKLSGLIYILDEPSLGLHRQDISKLQKVINELKDLNNTVILVEHEKDLIESAHHIVELGRGSGIEGGEITFQGTYEEMLKDKECLTGNWLSRRKQFLPPPRRKIGSNYLSVTEAKLHNLHHFSVKIPTGCLVAFCGVSGSGKSTLLFDIIGKPLQSHFQRKEHALDQKLIRTLDGYHIFRKVVLSEKLEERFSSRSIPATYINLMTPLRNLFAEMKLSKSRGYTASRFSLNKPGGRCEACLGTGTLKVDMDLLPDLFIPCDLCRGARYNFETLQVTFDHKNIADVLKLSIREASEFFKYIPTLFPTLKLMDELGLGYLTLGQSFKTLSGGEIQRLRLVLDLLEKTKEPTLYILDEPSSGLHYEDIDKLLLILHRLVDNGHTIFFIEHHLEMLKQADWIIEIGPGGGPAGGTLIFEGKIKDLAQADTPTGKVLSSCI